MNGLKNLAGSDVSVFLFKFELKGNRIEFIINEQIAMDMYQDIDEKINPLAHSCCETLMKYKNLSISDTIMDGNILDTGEFALMFSNGLGKYFEEQEKQNLFKDATDIHYLLVEVMERKTNV